MDTTGRRSGPARSGSPAPVSGVAVPIAVPPAIQAIRARWDLAASQGAEPHVTILYPFLAEERLTDDVREALRSIAALVEPFDVRFASVRRFDTVVWLQPDPPAPFLALTAAMRTRWPDHPPYGGAHDEVIPHLTVTEAGTAPYDLIEAEARDALPFASRAERLELWLQEDDGHWQPHWRFPLGAGG